MSELAYKRILVAIETDATRYHGENASRPVLLEPLATEQILAHISTDLKNQFPEISACSICLAGAVFDQTQLMRPDYPIYECLEDLSKAKQTGRDFEPALLGIGSQAGRMANSDLQPDDDIPLGLLQILPLVFSGDPALVDGIAESMEHRFLESGQLSAHSAKALESHFEIAVNHARFMTVTDLNAMLNLQLEHFGFLPLWQLLDAAINQPTINLEVTGREGQLFKWTGTAVRCTFETFDYWAGQGQGKTVAAQGQLLAKAYSDWTRGYRQYLTTLAAHAVPLEQVRADDSSQLLNSTYLIEASNYQSRHEALQVTEHSSGELGTVAVSVVGESGLQHYYPLVSSGLNDLHAAIRDEFGVSGGLSFPGSILYDESSRQLRPDTTHS
ncbi:MAG: hypothetical protein ACI9H8_000740 [Lysobacterales bacterium]